MKRIMAGFAVAAFGILGSSQASAQAIAQESIKLAFIDPLSGPFADVGEIMLSHIRFAIDDINAKGGVLKGSKLELMTLDNKLSAQESLTALQAAIDAGAKVVFTGGSGSSAVSAMVEAANKHNERNPEKAILIVNHSSIDPDLTGKNCSFWHFTTEANTAMKMKALTGFMKEKQDIKKVYLLNQDYAHGRVWARLGKEMLSTARSDVQFVGEDFHAIGKVKDFSPYVAKIKASGADTVISGNWGSDLNLLLKSAADSGMNLRYINHSAGALPGAVFAVSQAKLGQLTWVGEWHQNIESPKVTPLATAYKQRFNKPFLAPRMDMTPRIVAAAINTAGSSAPLKIALALEGMTYASVIGDVTMRKEDHQLLLPQIVSTVAPVDGTTVKSGVEGTSYGFRTETTVDGKDLALPTECKMRRPAGA
ncbi:branched-chain amino acid ABC transporter substrate-binding protein [Noviherbaspirillum sp. CPCC 100848]|uniref:Branched-chain amino acid ABC transporter substrate-binding protein n=1 Tax=Noviherbaspirillum album TaxID=3080276 RepID=A0ABU6JB50_9BURK|nr:branched-chain amino acid ABC transporter substrate-binding protein [Noviherbaspirillum sp. CPCC 100848]MEC4720874.1 branched-chain amino acid ABC transporter substrate-binding protein [Noviherbaspirillum sp. CPCC 100848]